MTLLTRYMAAVPEGKRTSSAIAYLAGLDHIGERHPLIAKKILDELRDQRRSLKLIASENYSSLATQLAMGNLLTDKYCEGHPFHRFYAGCENVDEIEQEAVSTLKDVFGCDHAYVQPHSGADANLVAFWSVLVHKIQSVEMEKLGTKKLNDLTPEQYERIRELLVSQKVLGMSLNSGGHLTHGYRMNISAKMMRAETYDVDVNSHLIDYAAIEKQALAFKPLILIAGYSAYSRKVNFARMRDIADKCGAVLMVDMAHFAGLVAGKVFTGEYNPIPYADIVTSTTHKTLRGPRGGMILCKSEYADVVNKGCPLVLGGPLPHVMAAKAVAFREAARPEFGVYAHQIVANARTLAEDLVSKGVSIVTGGTDNHLLVIDCAKSFGLNGRICEQVLREMGLTANRNTVPFDPNGAWDTSGVRFGTPALTTRGFGPKEMKVVAELIVTTLRATRSDGIKGYTIDSAIADRVKKMREDLLSGFPLYPEVVID